jgi:hypothetical protein
VDKFAREVLEAVRGGGMAVSGWDSMHLKTWWIDSEDRHMALRIALIANRPLFDKE